MCSETWYQRIQRQVLGVLCGSVSLYGTLTAWQPTVEAEPLHCVLAQASQLAQLQFAPLNPPGVPTETLLLPAGKGSTRYTQLPPLSFWNSLCTPGYRAVTVAFWAVFLSFLCWLFHLPNHPWWFNVWISQLCLYVIRESFVDLQLINLLKFQGERPRGSLTSPSLWYHFPYV